MTMITKDEPIRRTVVYTGHVQGVGFRQTACTVAHRFDVTGYVKNLPDGRVELVAEGEQSEVERFLAAVSDDLGACIDETQEWTTTGSGAFRRFEVRY